MEMERDGMGPLRCFAFLLWRFFSISAFCSLLSASMIISGRCTNRCPSFRHSSSRSSFAFDVCVPRLPSLPFSFSFDFSLLFLIFFSDLLLFCSLLSLCLCLFFSVCVSVYCTGGGARHPGRGGLLSGRCWAAVRCHGWVFKVAFDGCSAHADVWIDVVGLLSGCR